MEVSSELVCKLNPTLGAPDFETPSCGSSVALRTGQSHQHDPADEADEAGRLKLNQHLPCVRVLVRLFQA